MPVVPDVLILSALDIPIFNMEYVRIYSRYMYIYFTLAVQIFLCRDQSNKNVQSRVLLRYLKRSTTKKAEILDRYLRQIAERSHRSIRELGDYPVFLYDYLT